MTQIYNATTREPETLPDDQVTQALLQGTHSIPASSEVNVVDPDGIAGSMPATALIDALKNGYRVETATESSVRGYVQDNKGIKGSIKVALGKFADEAALGVPGLVFDKTADPLDAAKWGALKEDHAAAKALGSVTGFGAGLFVGAPLFKAAGAAGELASKAVASKLAKLGVERGSQSMAKDIVARMTTSVARMGTEGAIMTAPQAVTEAALGDPEQAAETVLAGLGVGMAFGLAGGAMSKPYHAIKDKTGALWDKTKGKFYNVATEDAVLKGAQGQTLSTSERQLADKTLDSIDPNTRSILDVANAVESHPEFKTTLAQQLSEKRPDHKEVEGYFKAIGGEASEGALSNKKMVRELESTIANNHTIIAGQGIRDLQEKNYKAVVNAATDALGGPLIAGAPISKFGTGQAVQQSLIEKVEGRGKEFTEKYGNIESQFERVAVSQKAKSAIARNLLNLDEVASTPNSETARYIKNVAKDIVEGRLDNLKQLKIFKSSYGKTINPDLKYAAGIVAEKLEDLEEASIRRSAAEMRTPKAKQAVLGYLKDRKIVNAEYAEFKDEMATIGKAIGRKRIRGAGDFADILADIPEAKLADTLLSVKNPKFLNFLKTKFPDEFEALITMKRGQLIEGAMHDGKVMPGKLFQALENLTKDIPEAKSLLLGDKSELYKAARGAWEAMPSQLNPSGTSRMESLKSLVSLKGWGGNISAMAGGAALKSPQALLYIESTMKHAAEKLDFIPKSIGQMNKVTGGKKHMISISAMTRLLDSSEEKKKDKGGNFAVLSDKITNAASNPALMADMVSKIAGPIQESAPNISGSFSQKMSEAIKYLDSQLPRPILPPNPMIKEKFKPSDTDLSAFERKLNTVMDPYSIIDDLKDGTLTSDQVIAVKTVYPKIYEQIQRRVVAHLVDNKETVPYQNRLKISLLMGSAFDPSLQPDSIRASQMAYSQQPTPETNQPIPRQADLGVAARTDPKYRAKV